MTGKILRNPQAVIGLLMMLAVILTMIYAPHLAPNDPDKVNIMQKFAEPSEQYPLGTDDMGRCIASRLIYGARISMSIALPTIAAIAVISVLLATVCAYIGGIVDKAFVVISNIFMALPPFLVAMTLVGLFESKAFSMQDAASSLDPHQTAEQELDEPLKLLLKLEKPQRQKRISELTDMVHFPRDRLKNKVSELSGGQQKRLCIARALAAEPQHILFDESFSGLDVTLRQQILSMLKELQKKLHIGFLIITHDLDTAMYMADRIYVMRFGKVIETLDRPTSFLDFKENYSKELVRAAEYKRQALHKS